MPFFNVAGVPRTVLSVVVIGSGAIAPGRLSIPDPHGRENRQDAG